MPLEEVFAFLVNNWELLAEMLQGIDKTGIELTNTKIVESKWYIPRMQEYKRANNSSSAQILEKNVFIGYGTELLHSKRPQSEIIFEQWCEINDDVEWVYKNGDKGQDYFSLVYRVSFRRYNFYPDYIIRLKNRDVWILEAKGGAAADGRSLNIDKYASQKFEALKEYGEKHPDIHWGFVRNSGAQLFISNTVWDENLFNAEVWKPIQDVIR